MALKRVYIGSDIRENRFGGSAGLGRAPALAGEERAIQEGHAWSTCSTQDMISEGFGSLLSFLLFNHSSSTLECEMLLENIVKKTNHLSLSEC